MLVDELRHLEHRDLALAAEDRLEVVVGVDHATLLGILQALPLDVLPELLGHFGARHGAAADDGRKLRAGLHRLHERGIGLPLGAALLRLLGRLLRDLPPTLLRALLLLRRHFTLSWSW